MRRRSPSERIWGPVFADSPGLADELDRLQTRTVLAFGSPEHIGKREKVEPTEDITLDGLPTRALPPKPWSWCRASSIRSLRQSSPLIGPHPGSTAEVTALIKDTSGPVVGVGFAEAAAFLTQVTLTRRGAELPGRGVFPFPGRTMIALDGHPQAASLGMLAEVVAEHGLPAHVLTLHQFQTRMIVDRERLDTCRPEIQHLVHVDGQGRQGAQQATWAAIRAGLPPPV